MREESGEAPNCFAAFLLLQILFKKFYNFYREDFSNNSRISSPRIVSVEIALGRDQSLVTRPIRVAGYHRSDIGLDVNQSSGSIILVTLHLITFTHHTGLIAELGKK